ncbi:MAG: protein-disulfide reductase DsbD family protein [Gemmatimonadota bacterium]|nr:protein-disulfide reductase DsbD family protein [Gemmatimonadota bacterium]
MNETSFTLRRAGGVVLAASLCVGAHQAQLAAQDLSDPSPHSDAELVAAVTAIEPGQPFTVALRLTMDDGWHSYWENPGDAGGTTVIEWSLPPEVTAGAVQWPFPRRIEAFPLVSYGYDGEVLLLVELQPSRDLPLGSTVSLNALADWVVCEEICLPASATLTLSLPVAAAAAPDPRSAPAIAETSRRLPVRLEQWVVHGTSTAGGFTIDLDPPEGWNGSLDGVYFFSADAGIVSHAAPQPLSVVEDGYRLTLTRSEFAASPAGAMRGTAVLEEGHTWDGSARALAVEVQLQARAPGTTSHVTLVAALLFAFVGGMILNLMPCVFPVLAIKILGFVQQSGADRKRIRGHGVAFAGGVVLSFWTLAAVLLLARAGGTQLGWGFQLQSPTFVAALAALFVSIGLNLMGVFEIGTSLTRLGGVASTSRGYASSVVTGVLATVVATPCIAPFMGTALGFALTQSAVPTLLIFGSLGLGMALPYVVFSMAPQLLRRLPRPGPWMETLRQLLAFPMFGAAIWLVWVFGRQTGIDGATWLTAGLLSFGFATWLVGRWNRLTVSRGRYALTRGLALAAIVLGTAFAIHGAGLQATSAARMPDRWEAFSHDRVRELRTAGRAVFVDFTADWCLTCKVNERVVLDVEEILEAFEQRGVTLLRADWTRRDPEITAALESFAWSGVPLYVLYPADLWAPARVLPVILTKRIVLEALAALDDGPAAASPTP